MSSRIVPRSCPEFAGLPSRLPTRDNLDGAHRGMRRHHRDKRLAAKLDELLGPVDDEDVVLLLNTDAGGQP